MFRMLPLLLLLMFTAAGASDGLQQVILQRRGYAISLKLEDRVYSTSDTAVVELEIKNRSKGSIWAVAVTRPGKLKTYALDNTLSLDLSCGEAHREMVPRHVEIRPGRSYKRMIPVLLAGLEQDNLPRPVADVAVAVHLSLFDGDMIRKLGMQYICEDTDTGLVPLREGDLIRFLDNVNRLVISGLVLRLSDESKKGLR